MIDKHIVLILGAGASAPYGFPLGSDLKRKIIKETLFLDQDTQILKELGFTPFQINDFAARLNGSFLPSVDAFLENNPSYMDIGKAAMALALIPYENLNEIIENYDDKKSNERWYPYLLDLLGNRDEFLSNQISIITFNYDRSLEYFLFRALMNRFGIDADKAVRLIESLSITHTYGQLGKPDFMDSNGRSYDPRVNVELVMICKDQINIIHEDVEGNNRSQLHIVQNLVQNADLLVFLGFGYHRKNIERLWLERYNSKHGGSGRIVGTCFGRGKGEIIRDKNIFVQQGVNMDNIDFYNNDVLGFLKETDFSQWFLGPA